MATGLAGFASAALARAARPAIDSTKAPRLIAPVLVGVFLSRGSLSRERPCRRSRPASEPARVSVRLGEVTQHEVENATLVKILELGRRIDPAAHREAGDLAVRWAVDLDHHLLARGDVFQVADRDDFLAGEAHALPAVVDELQRQHAHADEVRTVDALEGLGDHGADAQQLGALGRPVAR